MRKNLPEIRNQLTALPGMGELHEAYSNYLLEFDWSTYATFTFKTTRHDGCNAVNAVWEKLQDYFAVDAGFFAVEPHYLDGIHLHSLLWGAEKVPVARLARYSNKAFGWTHATGVKNSTTVAVYCTKYVVKGNDFYLKGDPGAWRTARF